MQNETKKHTHAATIWDGGGADANWSTVNNWNANALPDTGAMTFTGNVQTSTNNDLAAAKIRKRGEDLDCRESGISATYM